MTQKPKTFAMLPVVLMLCGPLWTFAQQTTTPLVQLQNSQSHAWKVDTSTPDAYQRPVARIDVPIVQPGQAMVMPPTQAPAQSATGDSSAQVLPVRPGTAVETMLQPAQWQEDVPNGSTTATPPAAFASSYVVDNTNPEYASQAMFTPAAEAETAVGTGVTDSQQPAVRQTSAQLPVYTTPGYGGPQNGAPINYPPINASLPASNGLPPIVSSSTALASPPPAAIRSPLAAPGPRATMTPYQADQEIPGSVLSSVEPLQMPLPANVGGLPPAITEFQPGPISQEIPQSFDAPPITSQPIPFDGVPLNGAPVNGPGFGDTFVQPPIGDGAQVAGCASCGNAGCGDQSQIASRFASCGAVAGARTYFLADVLYFDRVDTDGFVFTNAGFLGDTDFDVGWRFTYGRRFDYTSGDEISYLGTSDLTSSRETEVTNFALNALFVPGGFFGAAETSAFFNANRQIETRSTNLQSVEYNRVRWNWDVYKTFWGIRGINVNDEYTLFSEGVATGTLSLETNNFLLGPQIGGEYFYDVGFRGSWSVFGKLGAFANFNEFRANLENAGNQIVDNDSSSFDIAGALELGITGHYQLSSRARFRLGYNLLWLNNLAGATDNAPLVITSGLGGGIETEEEMFFQGFNFGRELFR